MDELLIVRHGIAEEYHPDRPHDDGARRLEPAGHAQALAVGRRLHQLGFVPGLVLHSPLVRTAQTATGLVQGLQELGGHTVAVEPAPWMAPGHSTTQIEAALLAFDALPRRVALVGHQPQVAELVAHLVARGSLRMFFERAGVAHLLVHRVGQRLVGELIWCGPPEVLVEGASKT